VLDLDLVGLQLLRRPVRRSVGRAQDTWSATSESRDVTMVSSRLESPVRFAWVAMALSVTTTSQHARESEISLGRLRLRLLLFPETVELETRVGDPFHELYGLGWWTWTGRISRAHVSQTRHH
jgi:hypothetical protein